MGRASQIRRDATQHPLLGTDHLIGNLRRRSVRGGATTLGAQALKFLLTLVSTALLARLLDPRDFGLIVMVTAVVGLANLFKDPGLSQATVQQAEVTQEQISTLFWLNAALGCVLTAAVAAVAPLLAWFYAEPRLVPVTWTLSGCLLLGGLVAQHTALLRRQMRYRALAVIEVVSLLAGRCTGIALALGGLGYWALVADAVVLTGVTASMAWVVSGWRPGWPCARAAVRDMVRFGAHLTGFNVLNYFSRNADNVLVGWYWGPAALGLYGKAYGLVLLPLQQLVSPISQVVVPALSRLQDDPQRYRRYYCKALLPLLAVTMPLVVFTAIEADSIVRLLLGEKWLESARIYRWLAPAALVGTSYVATGWVYVSLGRTDRQLRWGLISSAATMVAFILCLRGGVVAMAAGFSAVAVLLRYPGVAYCFRGTPLTVRDLVGVVAMPAVSSTAAATITSVGSLMFAPAHPLVQLLCTGAIFSLAYVGCWLLLPQGRESAMELIGMLRELRPGSARTPTTAAAPA